MKKKGAFVLPTLIVDPPTMLVLGLLYAVAGVHWLRPRLSGWWKEHVVSLLCVPTTLGFWIVGAMCYWDLPFFAERGLGNDFMWNGYLLGFQLVDTTVPTYRSAGWTTLAILLWAVQPVFLWLGVQAGYIAFGRTEHQTGLSGLYRD
jgi:hypothetical protein